MEGIAARVSAIKGDEIHGAAFLTEEALNILGDAAAHCPGDSGWEPCVSEVARALASAKPSMAGLRNATGRLLYRLVELGPLEGSRLAETLAKELAADLRKGAEAAAANAARLLPLGAVLATCSYSSAVVRTCREARRAGSSPQVLVFEPAVGPEAPGRRMAAELADLGLTARLVEGGAAGAALGGAQLALIGADAVTPELLINGTPSQSLAQAAAGRVPFYAVCETVKFTRDARADRGYDQVPLALVTAIATEEGVLAPDDVRRRIQEGGRAGPGHSWSSSQTA